ncbi:hypothetical protein B5F55_13295 [Anaerotruncus colihominis]|nr:hypothetical protein B5F55_13295 [Anaerotruncus colihominis]
MQPPGGCKLKNQRTVHIAPQPEPDYAGSLPLRYYKYRQDCGAGGLLRQRAASFCARHNGRRFVNAKIVTSSIGSETI